MKSTIFLAMKEYMYLSVHIYRILGIKTYCYYNVVGFFFICLLIIFEQVSIIWKGQHWYLFTCKRHTIVII